MWSSIAKFLIFIYSHLDAISPNIVPTKSSSCTISYLYRLAKYQHTRSLQEIHWWYMCTAVLPVQFLLITISYYNLEKELILGVLMCICMPDHMCHPACAQCTGHPPLSSWQQHFSASLATQTKKRKMGKPYKTQWSDSLSLSCQIISSWLWSTPNTPI